MGVESVTTGRASRNRIGASTCGSAPWSDLAVRVCRGRNFLVPPQVISTSKYYGYLWIHVNERRTQFLPNGAILNYLDVLFLNSQNVSVVEITNSSIIIASFTLQRIYYFYQLSSYHLNSSNGNQQSLSGNQLFITDTNFMRILKQKERVKYFY